MKERPFFGFSRQEDSHHPFSGEEAKHSQWAGRFPLHSLASVVKIRGRVENDGSVWWATSDSVLVARATAGVFHSLVAVVHLSHSQVFGGLFDDGICGCLAAAFLGMLSRAARLKHLSHLTSVIKVTVRVLVVPVGHN